MEVIRTFHPVGQGAFYSERHICDDKEYTVVYDCGSSKASNVENEIDISFKDNQEIEAVFISHLHYDHISGLEKLLSHCKVKKLFMPLLTMNARLHVLAQNMVKQGALSSFIRNLIINAGEDIDGVEVVLVPDLTKGEIQPNADPVDIRKVNSNNIDENPIMSLYCDCDWIFFPFNFKHNTRRTQLNTLLNSNLVLFKNLAQFEKLWNNKSTRNLIKDAYRKVQGSMNTNSMTLYSGLNKKGYSFVLNGLCIHNEINEENNISNKTACMYFGDYDTAGRQNWSMFIKHYKKHWDMVGIVQIPHHGSRYNYNREINNLNPKISIISAGTNNVYFHPHCDTIKRILLDGGIAIQITERKSSRRIFMQEIYCANSKSEILTHIEDTYLEMYNKAKKNRVLNKFDI